MRLAVFFQLRLRLSLQNTAELLNPDFLTQTGTKMGGGQLHIELSEPTSGPSLFTDGILEISLADGFLPKLSDTFDILDFNTVSDNFAEMNLPALEDGLLWDTSQLLVDGTLCVGGCDLTLPRF